MPRVIRRIRLVPNMHLLEIHAPEIARTCRPGQFVIVMPDGRGERIPLTIADWDRERGSVTTVVMIVGTTTRKLAALNTGDEIAVCTGPLGLPSDVRKFGTVLLAGGCFGIGGLFPVARALKEAGNRVLVLVDVKADYLLYWEDRLKSASDGFFVSSRDARFGTADYIPVKVEEILAADKIDRVHVFGCTYLLSRTAEATKPSGVKTIVNLNPIMLDGTGMCGACRVTVGGRTMFACVDGPDFDGHEVDWKELFTRRTAYVDDESRSLCRWEEENFS